jgi:hypothetical protein
MRLILQRRQGNTEDNSASQSRFLVRERRYGCPMNFICRQHTSPPLPSDLTRLAVIYLHTHGTLFSNASYLGIDLRFTEYMLHSFCWKTLCSILCKTVVVYHPWNNSSAIL